MSKFLTPPVWYDSNGNLVEILTGKIEYYGATRLTGSMSIGKDAYVGGNDSVAVGDSTIIHDAKTTAIGHNAVSRGNGNIVIGYQAESVSGSGKGGNVAIGEKGKAYGDGSIAIGQNTVIYGDGSIAIGSGIKLGTDEAPLNNTIQIGSSNVTYSAQIGDGKGLLRCRSLEVAPISYKISTYIDPAKNPVTISYPDKLILEKNGIYGFVFLVNGGRQTIPIVFNGTKSDAVKTYFNLSYGDTSDDYTIVYGSVVWGETDIKLRCSPFTAKDGTFIKIYLSYIVYFGSYQDS